MSDRAMPAPVGAVENSETHPSWSVLYRAAERFGVGTILLCAVLWWVRTDFIKPLLDAHYEFLHEIRKSESSQTGKLDTLIELMRSQNDLMQGHRPRDPKAASIKAAEPPAS